MLTSVEWFDKIAATEPGETVKLPAWSIGRADSLRSLGFDIGDAQ